MSMKAALFENHGSAEVLQIKEVETPVVGPKDVLIRVHSFALNRLDLWTRNGSPQLKIPLPHVGGSDVAGVIDKMGSSVKNFSIGDRVVINAGISCRECEKCRIGQESECIFFHMIGEHIWGGAAEYVKVPMYNILKIPNSVSFEDAAASALTSLTAYRMLVGKSHISSGDLVLVIGASGGVGVMGVQIAKYFDATVIALTSSKMKAKKLLELGADRVINYKEMESWSSDVYELSKEYGKKGVDIVFDSVGESIFSQAIRSLGKGGRYVTCGATTGSTVSINLALLFWKQLSVLGSTMASDSEFKAAMQLLFDGHIKAVIDSRYQINEIQNAHKKLEERMHFGKIVLQV